MVEIIKKILKLEAPSFTSIFVKSVIKNITR
jgi:hypothetical protein